LYSPNDSECFVRRRRRREDKYRTPWRRDYGRVIHSPAFRRLQGKTQLFPGIESDFFRNRLTHSLEAAQIAKAIATRLNSTEKFLQDPKKKIEPDIAELAALCHDLGHPPFGHNGERALDE
jgi:dGTPase